MGFKQRLREWLYSDTHAVCESVGPATRMSAKVGSIGPDRDDVTVNFNVTLADGGYIISFNRWDQRNDKNVGGIYVRGEDCNLGEEIEKLFTIEKLRG